MLILNYVFMFVSLKYTKMFLKLCNKILPEYLLPHQKVNIFFL